MRDYRSEASRIDDIISLITAHQDRNPEALFTHTYIQDRMEVQYSISGTLIRKYIRRAILRGQLGELRPSYDGSIGGLFILSGSPVYIHPVKAEISYTLTNDRPESDHPRQLALIATPERLTAVLERFVVVDGQLFDGCG